MGGRRLETDGLPEFLVYMLTEYGWTASQIDTLYDQLIELGTDAFVDDPDGTMPRVSSLMSAIAVLEQLEQGIRVRVDELGAAVRELTPEERAELDARRAAVEATFNQSTISWASLLGSIELLIGDATALLLETNNWAALEGDLNSAYGALIGFQQFDATVDGMQAFVDELQTSGAVTETAATLLDNELAAANQEIIDGEFGNAATELADFLDVVRTQYPTGISEAGAGDLVEYASYLISHLDPAGIGD